MRVGLSLLIVLCSLGAALAEAPEKSIRPAPRPMAQAGAAAPSVTAEATIQPAQSSLPLLAQTSPPRRPTLAEAAGAAGLTEVAAAEKPRKGLFDLLRPRARPAKKPTASRKGSVCDDPEIKGEAIDPIGSATNGCGIAEPVRLKSVAGVQLSQSATVDCKTARALKTWVQKGLQPAYGRDEVVELKIAAHYVCRSRNNVRGAKISEHGRGKAIDISGFVFASGKEISVLGNFNKTMRRAHKAACGIFSTTLGPGSDGYHEDHLHFDTASRRSGGAYCR